MISEVFPDTLIFIYLFISSIIGTSAMTLFMYLTGWIFNYNFSVIHLLGKMITFTARTRDNIFSSFLALGAGTIVHYAVGFVYVIGFHWGWSNGFGKPTFLYGLLLGVICGFIALIGWATFLKVHPKPPLINFYRYLIVVFIAHIIFSMSVLYSYLFIFRYPLPMDQSLN